MNQVRMASGELGEWLGRFSLVGFRRKFISQFRGVEGQTANGGEEDNMG